MSIARHLHFNIPVNPHIQKSQNPRDRSPAPFKVFLPIGRGYSGVLRPINFSSNNITLTREKPTSRCHTPVSKFKTSQVSVQEFIESFGPSSFYFVTPIKQSRLLFSPPLVEIALKPLSLAFLQRPLPLPLAPSRPAAFFFRIGSRGRAHPDASSFLSFFIPTNRSESPRRNGINSRFTDLLATGLSPSPLSPLTLHTCTRNFIYPGRGSFLFATSSVSSIRVSIRRSGR